MSEPKPAAPSASEVTVAMTPASNLGVGSGTPATVGGFPAAATARFGSSASVAIQDLSGDKLVLAAPRIQHDGKMLPSLGGIPLYAKLGQGGMGAVYYGIHPRLQKEVAVKVLPFHLVESQPGLVDRFFREAQIAARIESPHLVGVLDVNQESGLFFLVMEFVRGTSAGSYLKEVRAGGKMGLTEAEALDICIGGTIGLGVAHSERIVHRDVKPDNIMIPRARGGQALLFANSKLADLGLARSDEMNQSLTGSQACLGTPGYMSPEQCLDAKNCTTSSDIFSMGATLYALLCGEPPFSGTALMKVLMATAHEPHRDARQLRADVSPATMALIDKCLAKNALDRYPDAESLVAALRACRAPLGSTSASPAITPTLVTRSPSGAPISSLSPAVAAQTRMPTSTIAGTVSAMPQSGMPQSAPAKKSSAGVLIAAAVVLMLAAGGAFYWFQQKQIFDAGLLTTRGQAQSAQTLNGSALNSAVLDVDRFLATYRDMQGQGMDELRAMHQTLIARQKALEEREIQVSDALKEATAAIPESPEIAQDRIAKILSVGAEDRARNYPDLLAPIRNQVEELKRKTNDVRFGAVRTELVDKHAAALTASGAALTVAIDELEKFQIQNAFRNKADLEPVDQLLEKLRGRREVVLRRDGQFRQALTDALALAPNNPGEALKKLTEAETLGRADVAASLPDLLATVNPSIEQRRKEIEQALALRAETDFAREVAKARDATQRGELDSARVTLEASLTGLGERDHAEKAAAVTMLGEVRKELKRREDVGTKIREGDNWLKASEYEKAREAFTAALEAWPQTPDRARIELGLKTAAFRSAYMKADGLLNAGDLPAARKAFEDCKALWPDAPDVALVDRGIQKCDALMGEQQFDGAFAAGQQQLANKQYAQAIASLQAALKSRPNDPQATKLLQEAQAAVVSEGYGVSMDMGQKAVAARNFDEAEKHFRLALEAKPNDRAALDQIAKLEAARRGDQRYTDAMGRGNTALAGGRYAEAENSFREAQALRPDDAEAQKGIASARSGAVYADGMRDGRAALQARRWAQAKDAFERVLKVNPGDDAAKEGLKAAKAGERNEMIRKGLGGIGIRVGQ